MTGLERGLAYRHLGKLGYYNSIGARYLVIKDTFDLWATHQVQAVRRQDPGGHGRRAAEVVPGHDEGRQGDLEDLWGNEYCLVPLAVDLTSPARPTPFNKRLLHERRPVGRHA
jgi:alkaline phosphatase D